MSELFTQDGQRKYLNETERNQFLLASKDFPADIQTFCHVLALTGCRVSEALEMTAKGVDQSEGCLIFRSLKKRNQTHYRAVPVPPALFEQLNLAHNLRSQRPQQQPLWAYSRTTAWRHIKAVMKRADIEDAQASPKGLRHSFGVLAVVKGVPLNLLQRWLGHADITTTAIYAEALGKEEKIIAEKMW